MADRRPRRTRVWWLVGTDDVVVSIYVKRKRAVEVRDTLQRGNPDKEIRVIRVVELRPGERVIESPGGRGKRGRKT